MARHPLTPPPHLLGGLPDNPEAIKRALARHHQAMADLLAHWADLDAAEQQRGPAVQWITTREYGALWGRHRETVRTWINEGRLEGKRIGSEWRVDRDAVLQPKGTYTRQRAG